MWRDLGSREARPAGIGTVALRWCDNARDRVAYGPRQGKQEKDRCLNVRINLTSVPATKSMDFAHG